MPGEANIPTRRIIGCDVGKASIVVFDSRDRQPRTLPNQPEPLAAFAAALDPACLVVCEATGGYENALLCALVLAGRSVHRADARKVKAFIRFFGILGKSDAIDARALARYGAERHASLARWTIPNAQRSRLQLLMRARAEFVAQRTACSNRIAAPGAEPIRARLQALRDCLDAQIHALEAEVAATIKAIPDLARAEAVLRTIGGIGQTTAAALIALMPELGTLNGRQAAALAGLAPHPNQSGTSDAYRRTRGGQPKVKKTLFMAALAAARYDPTFRETYQHLCANGKKPIVAVTAIMRRIVVSANARLRDQTALVSAY